MKHRDADRVGGGAPGAPGAPDAQEAQAFAAVQAALERKPEVVPPADFAQRVARLAGALPLSRKHRVIAYARLTALVVALVVAIALFVLAPRTAADFRNLAFDLEMLALAQLGLLAWWLGRQPSRGR